MARRLGAAVCVFVSLLAPACRRNSPGAAAPPPPRPRLAGVTVRNLTPPEAAPARVDTDAIERAVRTRLLATGQFETDAARADGGAGGVTRALVQLGIDSAEVDDKGLARARVALRLETRPSDAPAAVDENLDAAAEQPYVVPRRGAPAAADKGAPPTKQAVFERLVLRIAGDLVDGFGARRRLRQATPADLRAAIAAGLVPIVCIGETLAEREAGETLSVLDRQIKAGFDGITGEQVGALVIAYEPVWAIGTGRTATAAQAQEAHAHIRQRLRQWFGAPAADECHVIYGGSVKPDNTKDLIAQPDVDGALVGGASLDIKSFFEIVSRSR